MHSKVSVDIYVETEKHKTVLKFYEPSICSLPSEASQLQSLH